MYVLRDRIVNIFPMHFGLKFTPLFISSVYHCPLGILLPVTWHPTGRLSAAVTLRQCSRNTPTELEVQDSGGLAAAWPARSRQRSHSHRSTQPPVLRHPSANINIKVTNKPSDRGCSGPQRCVLPHVNVLFLSGGTLWTEPRWTRSRVSMVNQQLSRCQEGLCWLPLRKIWNIFLYF